MNIKKLISEKIKLDGVDSTTVFDALTIPPNPQMGDLALPCFGFAKVIVHQTQLRKIWHKHWMRTR